MTIDVMLFVAVFLTVAIPLFLALVRKYEIRTTAEMMSLITDLRKISRKENSLITEDEYEATKAEIYRKLLALADRENGSEDNRISRRVMLNILAALLLVGIITYTKMGAFGYYDFPLHERLEVANDIKSVLNKRSI